MNDLEVRRALGLPEATSHELGEEEDWDLVEKQDIEEPKSNPAWHLDVRLRLGGKDYLRRFESSTRYERHVRSKAIGQSTSSAPHHEQSRLLSLPPELRLRIWEEVLRIPDEIVTLRSFPIGYLIDNGQWSVLDLLRTCRRVREEAEDIFYSLNQLRYPYGPSVPPYHGGRFLQSLSLIRKQAVRHIVFSAISAGTALTALTELRELPNIETLRIERTQSIRFTDVRSWRILTKQMQAALRKFQYLRRLEIVTPAVSDLTVAEEERMPELNNVDANLQDALLSHQDSAG